MSLRSWYDSLFVKPQAPFTMPKTMVDIARGAAFGAGVPTSLKAVTDIFAGLEEQLAGPTPQQMAEGPAPLVETARTLPAAARRNLAFTGGAVGGALAGALLSKRVPVLAALSGEGEALRFGGKALSAAERRMAQRVARERARVHAELEGKTGPLPEMPTAPSAGDDVDWALTAPTPLLQSVRRGYAGAGREQRFVKIIDAELERRGVKPDISGELHVLEEGPVAPPGVNPATQNFYFQHKRYLDEAAGARDEFAGQFHAREMAELEHPEMFITREERGGELLQKAGLPERTPSPAQQIGQMLTLHEPYRNLPVGTITMAEGERFVRGPKGWTRIGGTPRQKDFEVYLKRHFDVEIDQPPELRDILPPIIESRPEVAVQEIKFHGGWWDLPTDMAARNVVAKHIKERMKAGIAQPNEVVWLNVYEMRKRK